MRQRSLDKTDAETLGLSREQFERSGWGAKSSGRLRLGLLLLLAGVLLRQGIFHFVYRLYLDDSYVFMRYADNLAAGRGPVFNPNEFVMGFTSPLFMYLVTALKLAFPFLPTPTLLGVLNTGLFLLISFALLRSIASRTVVWWAFLVLWILYSPFVDGSLNGMETLLFVGLQYATVAFFARGGRVDWHLGIIAAALVALARPEGVCFCAAALAYMVWRRPRPWPWLGIVVLVLLGAGWTLYATVTFGSVIPQSLVAKAFPSQAGALAARASAVQMLPILALGLSSGLFIELGAVSRSALLGFSFVAFAVFAVGTIGLVRQRAPAVVLAAFFVLNWLVYVVGDPVRVWSWYTTPSAFAFWYCTFAGLDTLARRQRVLQQLILAGVVAAGTASLVFGVRSRIVTRETYSMPLREAARRIVREHPDSRSIMLGDIGIIGYYTNNRVIDLAGLISPTVLRVSPNGELMSYGELVAQEEPDIVITTDDILAGTHGKDALLLRRTFLTPQAKADFERDYADRSALYLPFRHVYVRRGVVGGPAH